MTEQWNRIRIAVCSFRMPSPTTMIRINLRPATLAVGRRRIHYAWMIVIVAAAMRLCSSAIRTSFPILVPRMMEAFGWTYGQVGGGLALQWIFSGLFGPPAGWLGDRYGIRRVMAAGAVIFLISMVLTSRMTHLWQFYLFYGVFLSASMAIFQVPLVAAVSLWFRKHLGVGMGILQSAQGVGPLVFVPMVLLIIHLFGGGESGLRAAFWTTSIGGGVVILLLIRLFYNEPAQAGLRPLGASPDEPIQSMQEPKAARLRTKHFMQRAQRTSAFWNLIGIHFWGCAGHAIIMAFLPAMAEARGLSPELAAGLFVVLSVLSTITRFGVPIVADRLGSKWVMAACFFLQVAPLFILFFAHDAWLFYLFAALFGIGFGGEMTAFPIINRQYYGSAPIGTTYGWQMMGAGIGMAVGAYAGGLLWDFTGDLNYTIALSLVLSLVGVASIMFLPGTHRQQLPDWEDSLPPEYRSVPARSATPEIEAPGN